MKVGGGIPQLKENLLQLNNKQLGRLIVDYTYDNKDYWQTLWFSKDVNGKQIRLKEAFVIIQHAFNRDTQIANSDKIYYYVHNGWKADMASDVPYPISTNLLIGTNPEVSWSGSTILRGEPSYMFSPVYIDSLEIYQSALYTLSTSIKCIGTNIAYSSTFNESRNEGLRIMNHIDESIGGYNNTYMTELPQGYYLSEYPQDNIVTNKDISNALIDHRIFDNSKPITSIGINNVINGSSIKMGKIYENSPDIYYRVKVYGIDY